MRLKIIKRVAGEIDGVSLGRFVVGDVHEVGTTLASYLLALGAAVPIVDGQPIVTIPREIQRRSRHRNAPRRRR